VNAKDLQRYKRLLLAKRDELLDADQTTDKEWSEGEDTLSIVAYAPL